MPFQYATAPNPAALSIGDLLERPGAIEAARAMAVAQAQARADEIRGQAWAGAATGIANAAGNAVQQITDPRRQADAMALKDMQDRRAGQQLIDTALKPQVQQGPAEGGGNLPPTHPYLDDQSGLVDPEKVTHLLEANGMAHLAPDLLKGIETQNDAITKGRALQQDAAKQQAIMLGSVANTTLKLMAAGFPFDQAAQHASSSLVATGMVKPEQVQQQISQLSQLPQDQITAQLQQMKATAARLGPTKTLTRDASEIDMFGDTVASNIVPDKKTNEAELASDAADQKSPTAAQSKAALEMLQAAKRAPVGGELKFGRVDGKGPVIAAVFKPDTQKIIVNGEAIEPSRFQAPTDPAERQAAAIAAQVAQQARSQDFETKKQARSEIDKINQTFLTARTSADTLRDVVASAQAGNKVAGSLQALETTMAAIRAQGLNRINATEVGVTANAGNIWDRIVGWFGKKVEGQPVPADIQKDMKDFADILDKAAYKKYGDAHDATNKLYGTDIPRTFAVPSVAAPAAPPTLTPGLQGLAAR